jgi:two-component system, OmpR family, response regulator ResD
LIRSVQEKQMTEVPPKGRQRHTILIVEDDPQMAQLVRGYLEQASYDVMHAETGEAAIEMIQARLPHLVILDLMLPLRSGWDVCRMLRARSAVPIIMVTARRTEEDRLRGFAEGADDYVVKPFSPRELVARVGAVLRREHAVTHDAMIIGMLQVDPLRREAQVQGRLIALREREFDLLAYMATRAGEVCARRDLLDHVWGYGFAGDERTLDTHVSRLRDALDEAGTMIQTVWGVGYRLAERKADDQ